MKRSKHLYIKGLVEFPVKSFVLKTSSLESNSLRTTTQKINLKWIIPSQHYH